LDGHGDHASHLSDACERKPFAGLLMHGFRHSLHTGAVHAGRHGMAHFHRLRERWSPGIGSLLTEQAEQRSQEEKEGKMTFHTDTVGRGRAGVNDYPP
jgi:hypothetical protein